MARRDEIVEDITGGIPEWLPCDEIWYAMSWLVVLVPSGCRDWYVWTTNVVTTAEKRAALRELRSIGRRMIGIETHEDQHSIDVVCIIDHDCIVMRHQVILNSSPPR